MNNIKNKRSFINEQRGDGGFILGIIVIAIVVLVALIWGGIHLFKPASYETVTKISYSVDGGYNYREGIQEIDVNQEYYMCVEMQVVASKDVNAKTIKATIILEQTDVVSCYLDDNPGQPITGQTDEINHTITYTFDIPSSTAPSKFRVVFRCEPATIGNFRTVVSYDDRVAESWDKTENIRYV